MNKIRFLFVAIILQCSFLYADINLQEYVESVSYEKGELLCYSVAYPLSLYMQSGMVSPSPITSRDHIFWRDDKYRRAMLEWMFLVKDAFQTALGSSADESLLTLYAQYPMYLVNSKGFQDAIEDCSKKYYPQDSVYNEEKREEYEELLTSQIKEMALFSNKYASMTVRTAVIEVPMSVVGGVLLFRAIKGTWRVIRGLYRATGNGYRRLRGITFTQAAILQTQKQQFKSMTKGFFHFTKSEAVLELGLILYINRQLSVDVSAYYEDVKDEVFDQKIKDRPSTRVSPLPEVLYHYRVDENLHTRLETWWNAKIEDYRVLLIQQGIDVRRLSETHPESLDFYNALNEYLTRVDLYLVDYWLVKGLVDWFRQQFAANRLIQGHHQRSYEILSATLQVMDVRKRQLERHMNELENGHAVNMDYNLEHLKAIFDILDQSRDTRYSPYIEDYFPYGYCLSMDDYKAFVFKEMSDQQVSETEEWQLCRFHQLQIFRRLGNELYAFEEREFRELLRVVNQL